MISLAEQCQEEERDPYAELAEDVWPSCRVAYCVKLPKPAETLETPPSVLQHHAELLAADEPVQKSDRAGIYSASIAKQIADAMKPPTLPPSKPKAPEGFDVLAPMNGRVGGKWGL